jgi:hypothetical protein
MRNLGCVQLDKHVPAVFVFKRCFDGGRDVFPSCPGFTELKKAGKVAGLYERIRGQAGQLFDGIADDFLEPEIDIPELIVLEDGDSIGGVFDNQAADLFVKHSVFLVFS